MIDGQMCSLAVTVKYLFQDELGRSCMNRFPECMLSLWRVDLQRVCSDTGGTIPYFNIKSERDGAPSILNQIFRRVLEWQRLRLPCLCLQRSNKQTNREGREAHVLVSINAGKSTYCFSWLTKSKIWITTAFAQELWNAPGVLFMSTLWNKLCFFPSNNPL